VLRKRKRKKTRRWVIPCSSRIKKEKVTPFPGRLQSGELSVRLKEKNGKSDGESSSPAVQERYGGGPGGLHKVAGSMCKAYSKSKRGGGQIVRRPRVARRRNDCFLDQREKE